MDQTPRSSFVSILALVSAFIALYSIIQDISTLSMQENPELQIAKQLFPSAIVSSTTLFIEILLNIAAIAASVGLYLRFHWGRISYIAILSLFTVWEIYSSISTYMTFNKLLAGYGLGGSLSLIIVWSVIGIGITIYVIWKLSSDTIVREFSLSKNQQSKGV